MSEVPPYGWRDEADLLWYHGLGQTAFERSTFGSMLERAEQFGMSFAWPQEPVLNSAGDCIGYRSAISARPTAETHEVSGYVPDSEVLTRAARVSKIMMQVERRGVLSTTVNAAEVIAVYFGDLGARWAGSPTGHGRFGSLFHLTVKGRAMIDEANREANSVQLTPVERIEIIAVVNKAQPKQPRSEALAVCGRQAVELERKARAVWHEVQAVLRAQ